MLNFFTIVLIGISLSMDAFSLSILYGTILSNTYKIYLLSVIVGIYHFVMPFLGNLIGNRVLTKLPIPSDMVVGIILILIALEMILTHQEEVYLQSFISFLIFGFTVSLDSFSVGVGISSITNNYLLSFLTFTFTSMFFTYIGLKFGKYLNYKFGNLATKFGGLILIVIGISYIF